MVDHLSPWRASALHNTDRYALQVVVEASEPMAALRVALDLHGEAVRRLRLPAWDVVRTEVMTLQELERGWDEEPIPPPVAPRRAWEMSPTFVARVHQTARALLRATSVEGLTSVLTHFIQVTGGWVVGTEGPSPWILSSDLSLGRGQPRFAAAEPFSTARLLLEEILPGLVEDANCIAELMRPPALPPEGVPQQAATTSQTADLSQRDWA